ncbi:hypothetical protein AB0G54_24680 [Streptomyces yokosukanensis]|uniref:hypothetical protein n=1 Tax=Streptomyces yokosukanensis TaxID=67386 RepID=UPI00341C51B4
MQLLADLADLDVSVVHPGHGRSFGPDRLGELAQGCLHGTEAHALGGKCAP